MSTLFVRLFSYDPIKDPTARLRVEYDPDFGNAILADENTLPEQVKNPDARFKDSTSMQLTNTEVRWLATTLTELANRMDKQDMDNLIDRSSVGQGLADIKARGIDAHLRDLEREMKPKRKQ